MDYPLAIQFPDLAEIYYHDDQLEDIKGIKTEFIFHLAALSLWTNGDNLGFKAVSSMNNWYTAHRTQTRRMTLYWMKNPYWEGEPQKPFRINWAHNRYGLDGMPYQVNRVKLSEDSFLAGSGCGFAIGEPPFVPRLMHRFFTLMRIPIEVKSIEKRWLTKHNYRHLDTGKIASYWINGWPTEEYDFKKECAYFNVNAKWEELPKVKKELKKVSLT